MGDSNPKASTAEQLAELQEGIMREHRDQPHPAIEKGALKAHLLVHGMVEKQLLENNPPETTMALERLMEGGKTRHEAVHLIGQAVTREAAAMLRQGREMDMEAYRNHLAALAVRD
jgi:hypothetical protein